MTDDSANLGSLTTYGVPSFIPLRRFKFDSYPITNNPLNSKELKVIDDLPSFE